MISKDAFSSYFPWCGCRGNKDRRIKLQYGCLDKKEHRISKWEADRNEGIIPLAIFAFTEQEPVCYVKDGKNNVEYKASDSPVCLRIASLCARKHNVEHKERKKNTKHAYKLKDGRNGNEAVFFFLCGLNKRCKHNANAKEVTDICEMNVEIPTNYVNVIKDSKTRNKAHKSERTVNSLENKLRCSVFNHNFSLFLFVFYILPYDNQINNFACLSDV